MPSRSGKSTDPRPSPDKRDAEPSAPAPSAPSAPAVPPTIKAALERILKSTPKDLHAFLGTATTEQINEYHNARIAGEQAIRADAFRR